MCKIDYDKFHEFLQLNEAIQSSSDYHIDFSKYKQNKARFIEKFGGTIYRVPMTLNPGDPEYDVQAEKALDEFIDHLKLLQDSLFKNVDTTKTIEFLKANGADGFVKNRVVWGGPKIKLGMKLTKAIKILLLEQVNPQTNDNYWIEWVQTQYSRISAAAQPMTGYLHLSVDPVDFVSMSESGYSWRTCQSMNGDYAAGTLGLMGDSSTIVAYVTTEEQREITDRGIKWWPKKWRALVHINDFGTKFIVNKHYPNYSYANEEAVVNEIKKIWSEVNFDGDEYLKKYVQENNLVLKSVVSFVKNKTFYNDFNSDYDPRLVFSSDFSITSDESKIFIGVSVKCAHCRDMLISEPMSFSCDFCRTPYHECERCGDVFGEDEMVYDEILGFRVCDTCSLELDAEREVVVR